MQLDLKEYKLIVESSPNMIWRSGIDANCNYFNQTWLAFTGKTIEQEIGAGWAQGVHPDDLERCLQIYNSFFKKRQPFEMNYRLMRHDGEYRWINDRGVPITENGVFKGFIGSCMDITEKIEGQALKTMAEMDAVCGIFNRQFAYKLLKETLQQPQSSFSLVMLDIDDFKKINDTYGHLTGDMALKHVAAILQKTIRKGDVLGRYGGDEFILGLNDTVQKDVTVTGERFRQEIANLPLILPEGQNLLLTVSLGVTAYIINDTLDSLIQRADKALYAAKEKGKNSVAFL